MTQLAKLRGGRVIATTSTPEKAQLARDAGADEVIGYDDFAAAVRELTGGAGVAAVYDGVGKTTFMEGLKALAPTGRMILYGAASGQPDPLDRPVLAGAGSLYVQRPTLATYTRTPQLLRERATAVLELVAAGRLTVRIGATLPARRGPARARGPRGAPDHGQAAAAHPRLRGARASSHRPPSCPPDGSHDLAGRRHGGRRLRAVLRDRHPDRHGQRLGRRGWRSCCICIWRTRPCAVDPHVDRQLLGEALGLEHADRVAERLPAGRRDPARRPGRG